MIYDPKPTKYPFPEDTSAHYIKLKKNDGAVFDSSYPYIDKTPSFLFRQKLTRILLYLVVFPVARIRLGLRIRGKKNLKLHKDELKNGVVSCSNHVHFWDYIAIMCAVKPRKPYVLTWPYNIRGENKKLIRLVGGIPIPENDPHAAAVLNRSLYELMEENGWVHVYSEGSMWEYYCPIRPFKDGTAYIACKSCRPILPMAFSYRRPGLIRRKIFRQTALLTLRIGEPLYKNETLPRNEQKADLTKRSHDAVCLLAGIDPEKNVYPPLYDDSKRIDYYEEKTEADFCLAEGR